MRRVVIAVIIGFICFLVALAFRSVLSGSGDIWQALAPALDLLQGRTALSRSVTPFYVPSPLTIVPLGLLFVPLSNQFGAALFAGLSCTWLAWHYQNPSWRLLAFLSFPLFVNVELPQYAPLLIALSLSRLAPLGLLVKPNIALPLAITLKSRRAAWIVALFIAVLSLIIFGAWPIEWIEQLAPYHGFIPLLTFPGILIPSVLLFRRDRPAWLLVLMALMPQRGVYDVLALSLIPNSKREMLLVTFVGWCAYLASLANEQQSMVLFCYIPCWIILIAHSRYTSVLSQSTMP